MDHIFDVLFLFLTTVLSIVLLRKGKDLHNFVKFSIACCCVVSWVLVYVNVCMEGLS